MRIIPAIDIIEGKCVRLSQGDFTTKKIYNEDPLEIAKSFEDHGLTHLHLVDLDGAISKGIINYKILYKIATKTGLKIDFGGGIKELSDVSIAFENGANQITVGSVAIDSPEIAISIITKYGKKKIILGADCIDRKISTHGWLNRSDTDVVDFINTYCDNGLEYVICTDINKDGMLAGPSFDLYKELLSKTKVQLIASGGISSVDDLEKLKLMGCEGAILGKAIYENKISLQELSALC